HRRAGAALLRRRRTRAGGRGGGALRVGQRLAHGRRGGRGFARRPVATRRGSIAVLRGGLFRNALREHPHRRPPRRQALLACRTRGAPIDRGRVELELHCPQELLRVAANGSPPYLLAAGTRSADAGPDATFAAVWRRLDPSPAPARAALGTLRELGGAAALVE